MITIYVHVADVEQTRNSHYNFNWADEWEPVLHIFNSEQLWSAEWRDDSISIILSDIWAEWHIWIFAICRIPICLFFYSFSFRFHY